MKNEKNVIKKGKMYFVPNYKNNLLTLFMVVVGYFFLAMAFWGGRIAPIPLVLSLICLVPGFALAVVRPTFCTVSESGISIFYAFGFFRESGNWDEIKKIYDLTYRIGRTRDTEKVFSFEGLRATKRRKFMKSEIEKNKKLGRLIREFWGEPTVRDVAGPDPRKSRKEKK